MTETTLQPAGGPGLPGPAPDKRRRLVVAGAVLALAFALLGAHLLRGGSGGTPAAAPVPHAVRSPNPAVPPGPTPARSPAGKPAPVLPVARNPFLPLVVVASAGGTAVGTDTGTGATGALPTPTASTGTDTTSSGSTSLAPTSGTTGNGSAASPAAPVEGNPNFTG